MFDLNETTPILVKESGGYYFEKSARDVVNKIISICEEKSKAEALQFYSKAYTIIDSDHGGDSFEYLYALEEHFMRKDEKISLIELLYQIAFIEATIYREIKLEKSIDIEIFIKRNYKYQYSIKKVFKRSYDYEEKGEWTMVN